MILPAAKQEALEHINQTLDKIGELERYLRGASSILRAGELTPQRIAGAAQDLKAAEKRLKQTATGIRWALNSVQCSGGKNQPERIET